MLYIIISLVLGLVFAGLSYSREEDSAIAISTIGGIVVAVLWGIVNYLTIPAIGFGYPAIWWELFLTLVLATIVKSSLDGWDYTGWITVTYVVFWIICGIASSEMVNSKKYNKMMSVEEVEYNNFAEDINLIPVDKMIVADYDLARKVADDKLEEDPGLGSRCDVGNMTLQNLTGSFVINNGVKLEFNDELVWVAPLEHSGFWRWMKNDITPGYVIVYANDPTRRYLVTEVNGEKLEMRYLESAYFSEDIERHIRNNGYHYSGLTEHNFEITPDGHPYWVLCNYEPTIGIFGGKDSKGVITVDIQSGEVAQYKMEETPAWVDHIQPEKFVYEQIRYWGEYRKPTKTWRNARLYKEGVQVPTPGMVLVYSEGESYWYTGISAAKGISGNGATSGFMLVNARTKAAKYYKVAGVNELEGKKIAEDQNFAKAAQYQATSPVLYNVKGVPTYFMTFKGSSGNITGYAFVAVTNRQAVGVGSSKKEAETNYLQSLRRTGNDTIADGPVVAVETKSYTVRDITLEGTTYYVLFNEVKGKEFTGSTEFFRELKWTKPNDRVEVSYSEGESTLVLLDSFENLDFEF